MADICALSAKLTVSPLLAIPVIYSIYPKYAAYLG